MAGWKEVKGKRGRQSYGYGRTLYLRMTEEEYGIISGAYEMSVGEVDKRSRVAGQESMSRWVSGRLVDLCSEIVSRRKEKAEISRQVISGEKVDEGDW